MGLHSLKLSRKISYDIPKVAARWQVLTKVFNYHDNSLVWPGQAKQFFMMIMKSLDKISLEDSTGVVYQIHVPCKDCDKGYVGETGRKFGVRKAEHKQEAETLQKAHFTRSKKKEEETTYNKSAISNHVAQENRLQPDRPRVLQTAGPIDSWVRQTAGQIQTEALIRPRVRSDPEGPIDRRVRCDTRVNLDRGSTIDSKGLFRPQDCRQTDDYCDLNTSPTNSIHQTVGEQDPHIKSIRQIFNNRSIDDPRF